jgi:hypothetical protein
MLPISSDMRSVVCVACRQRRRRRAVAPFMAMGARVTGHSCSALFGFGFGSGVGVGTGYRGRLTNGMRKFLTVGTSRATAGGRLHLARSSAVLLHTVGADASGWTRTCIDVRLALC